jgi:very-short-patch-repair endonuclease
MSFLPPAVHRLLARQHGVASTHQLRSLGLSARQIEHHVHGGNLLPVVRGAVRSPAVPFDELGRCAALCLARPEVAIAAQTAGRLWGLRRVAADRRVHLLAPPAANPTIAPWAVTYRTAAVHADDIVQRDDGIRLTTRPRTALDLARHLGDADLLSVIEQVLRDGNHSVDELRSVAVDWMSPRRPWLTRFLALLDRRLAGAPAESHPEVRLGDALRRRGVTGLERQHPVDLPGYGRARFDLALPALRWAIEVDVHPSHEESAGRESDARRDAAAGHAGWLVTRVSRARYETAFDETVEHLVEVHHRLRSAHDERPHVDPGGRSRETHRR